MVDMGLDTEKNARLISLKQPLIHALTEIQPHGVLLVL